MFVCVSKSTYIDDAVFVVVAFSQSDVGEEQEWIVCMYGQRNPIQVNEFFIFF